MVSTPDAVAADRRTVLRSLGTLAAGVALAGCTTGDGDGGDDGGDGADGGANGGDGGDGGGDLSDVDLSDAESYVSATSNYDEPADRREADSVAVDVGASGNGANFAFEPPLVVVSTGTTVTWEWTGEGGNHNVVAADGTFDSGTAVADASTTFEYTFDETGTFNYYCSPHERNGMVGSVVVV